MRDKLIVELKADTGELLQVLEIDVPKGTVSDTATMLINYLDVTFSEALRKFEKELKVTQ